MLFVASWGVAGLLVASRFFSWEPQEVARTPSATLRALGREALPGRPDGVTERGGIVMRKFLVGLAVLVMVGACAPDEETPPAASGTATQDSCAT